MAHAYETFVEGGKRIGGTLGTGKDGPVGIAKVEVAGRKDVENKRRDQAGPRPERRRPRPSGS